MPLEIHQDVTVSPSDAASLARGIVPAIVSCPKGVDPDALLIATWRADHFKRPLRQHLARARRLIDRSPERFGRVQVALSDHDWATFKRLGGAGDVEACMVAAWLVVGVKTVKRTANVRSLWDHKLIERRVRPAAAF